LAFLLFLSGVSALVFQILWIKQLTLIVGLDVHAITIAVSAFFGGLAAGSFLFGRWADRIRRPLMLYGLMELCVGLLGVGSTVALAHTAPLFATVDKWNGLLAWTMPLALVGVPATVMGGTLPVLVRVLASRSGPISSEGGRLYAANTAGGVAGVLFASFVLIPAFGVFGSALAAATLNAIAALGAVALGRQSETVSIERLESSPAPRPAGFRLALLLYCLAGSMALGYEVVWSQVLAQWTSTRTFAFAVVLATYLMGLVIGSALYARLSGRVRDPWGLFGFLIASAGVTALVQVGFLGDWLSPLQVKAATAAFAATGVEPVAMAVRFVVASACVVLLPAILLGATFPAALRLAGGAERAGRDTGRVLALNTLGGIAGTLITGFVLVPAVGLERSLAILAVSASITGVIAVARETSVRLRTRVAVFLCFVVAIVTAVVVPPDKLAMLLASQHKGELLFHDSGAGGTVAVLEQGPTTHRFRRLYIQGVSNSGDSMASLRYMRLQALVPLIIHRGEPRSALVIGLGTGITAGSLLCYEGLDRRVCAELMPEVVRGASFFRGNFDVVNDERVEFRLHDGRRELLRNDETYDLITLEPPPPSAAGVVNLYSEDFYALAATRLRPEGLLAQWLPLPTQTREDTRSLIRSFLDVFPYVSLWTTELHEMLLIGSTAPIKLDGTRIASRYNQPGVAAALREVGIASPAALLSTFVTDRDGLARFAGDARTVTDDLPSIEYGAWVLPGEFERVLPSLLELQIEPPLSGSADTGLSAAITEEREVLHSFYAAALYSYAGDRAKWNEALSRVLNKDSANPYYRGFLNVGSSTRHKERRDD
jgi:predicted membrane-bound spermidine synthase